MKIYREEIFRTLKPKRRVLLAEGDNIGRYLSGQRSFWTNRILSSTKPTGSFCQSRQPLSASNILRLDTWQSLMDHDNEDEQETKRKRSVTFSLFPLFLSLLAAGSFGTNNRYHIHFALILNFNQMSCVDRNFHWRLHRCCFGQITRNKLSRG